MKRESLQIGQRYLTKIGREWKPVTLTSLRDDIGAALGCERPKEVIVRTEAYNHLYRMPSQLRKIPEPFG